MAHPGSRAAIPPPATMPKKLRRCCNPTIAVRSVGMAHYTLRIVDGYSDSARRRCAEARRSRVSCSDAIVPSVLPSAAAIKPRRIRIIGIALPHGRPAARRPCNGRVSDCHASLANHHHESCDRHLQCDGPGGHNLLPTWQSAGCSAVNPAGPVSRPRSPPTATHNAPPTTQRVRTGWSHDRRRPGSPPGSAAGATHQPRCCGRC